VFPGSFSTGTDLESGNKIILPLGALDALTRRRVTFPMFFRLVNPAAGKATHCGVLEFTAPEGCVYLPQWIMDQLEIQQEEFVFVKNVVLPKGELVLLQPHFTRFTELSNPRAV
jgi:ubiquitin fusion degradation protein 1